MRVLVACEFSGIVRDAFAARGHDAWSCDLLPTERPGNHIQGDVLSHLGDGWNMMLGFPPCDDISLSGCRWAVDHWVKRKNKPPRWHDGSKKRAGRERALAFFKALLEAPIKRVCLENPMSLAVRVAPKSQVIQMWQFGHGEKKTTWLWLRNLPPLVPTDIVDGREETVWRMPPSPTRAMDRSRTRPGVADAMADQWGSL